MGLLKTELQGGLSVSCYIKSQMAVHNPVSNQSSTHEHVENYVHQVFRRIHDCMDCPINTSAGKYNHMLTIDQYFSAHIRSR